MHVDCPGVRREDSGEALQECRLPRTVGADDPEGGTVGYVERDVIQCTELIESCPATAKESSLQVLVLLVVETEVLRDIPDRDCRLNHKAQSV